MTETPGIDVASYQPLTLIEQAIHGGARFGFVKATEGVGYVNPLHLKQLAMFHHHALPAGLFHFLRHDESARAQWRHFREHVAPHRGSVVIAVDHEPDEAGVLPSLALVRRFVRFAHADGYKIVRYADVDTFKRGQVGADARWLAEWGTRAPSLPCRIWQQRGTGQLDRDVFMGDEKALRAFWKRMAYHERRRLVRPVWWA